MATESDSQISESDVRQVLGKAYSEDVLNRLRLAETTFQEQRVALSTSVGAAVISVSEYARNVNRLFDVFLEEAAQIVGDEPCRSLFDAAPSDGFELIDIEESAREDTRRLQYAKNVYAPLYPYSADRLVAVRNFLESLRASGTDMYVPLAVLLHAIRTAALVFAAEGSNHEAWFILVEAKDTHNPFFEFVQDMYNYGYTLNYASDNTDVEREVDELKIALQRHHGTNKPEEVKDRVRFRALHRTPRVTNLCFLNRQPETVPIGFWTIPVAGITIGGWSMTEKEAMSQWQGLLDFVKLPPLKVSDAG